MPKLPRVTGRKLVKALQKEGFERLNFLSPDAGVNLQELPVEAIVT